MIRGGSTIAGIALVVVVCAATPAAAELPPDVSFEPLPVVLDVESSAPPCDRCDAPPPRAAGLGRWRREDYRFRPFSVGTFAGCVTGGGLGGDGGTQDAGYLAGYLLGWDWNRHWGCQARLAFGYVDAAEQQPTDVPLQDGDILFGDIDLVYYPFGNRNWRPYLLAGFGGSRLDVTDRATARWTETVCGAPLAAGVKIRWSDRVVLRFEAADNIAFANDFATTHDLSFTVGIDWLLGGTCTAYWPWNPGRRYW